MQSSRTLALSVLLLAAISLSCRTQEQPVAQPPGTVATVGTRTITRDDFTRYLERNTGTTLNQLAPAAASALIDQFVDELLLSQHASDAGIVVSNAAVTEALRNDPGSTVVEKRDELQRMRLLNDMTSRLPQPSTAEVAAYYSTHADEFRGGEQVRLRQILVRSPEEAANALKELKKGEPFDAVSVKYSRAPNAARGGEIGLVERGQLPKVFEEVVFSLDAGELSGVVKSDSNLYHIFRVDEKLPAGGVPLEQATPLIEQRLKEDRLRQEVERVTAETAKARKVRLFKERLGFPYNGRYPAE